MPGVRARWLDGGDFCKAEDWNIHMHKQLPLGLVWKWRLLLNISDDVNAEASLRPNLKKSLSSVMLVVTLFCSRNAPIKHKSPLNLSDIFSDNALSDDELISSFRCCQSKQISVALLCHFIGTLLRISHARRELTCMKTRFVTGATRCLSTERQGRS